MIEIWKANIKEENLNYTIILKNKDLINAKSVEFYLIVFLKLFFKKHHVQQILERLICEFPIIVIEIL